MRARGLLGGVLLGLSATLAGAQFNTGAQRSSGRLDEAGLSARDAALANAVVASQSGPGAVAGNPALLAGQRLAVTLDQSNSVLYQRSLLGGVLPTARWGSLAASLGYADFGSIDLQDPLSSKVLAIRPFQGSLGVGLGKELGYGFSGGVALNALHQDFGFLNSYRSWGGTLGLVWRSGAWSLGLAQDLQSELDSSGLVFSQRVGAAFDQAWMASQAILISTELMHDQRGLRALRAGVENRSYGVFALRGGYDFEPSALRFDDFQGRWTGGVGFRFGHWNVDLSYGYREQEDVSQRATLSWAP